MQSIAARKVYCSECPLG